MVACTKHAEAPVAQTQCLPNGAAGAVQFEGFGSVEPVYDGFGCIAVASMDGVQALHMRPKAAIGPTETHAALALGAEVRGDLELSCRVLTSNQNRLRAPSNPHEVGWLVWQYADNQHFYYFMAKPNGWELGKRDPAYPGGQRFLATGTDLTVPVHQRCTLKIIQKGTQIQAFLDGQPVTTFNDRERPYTSGRAGFYCEDADVFFDTPQLLAR